MRAGATRTDWLLLDLGRLLMIKSRRSLIEEDAFDAAAADGDQDGATEEPNASLLL